MPKADPKVLATRPAFLRSAPTRGLSAEDPPGNDPRIDRAGGDYGAGIIRNFAVITRGEALGHYMWVDGEFVDSVGDALAATDGVRVRFTHPDMSSDGLGRKLGRAKFARRDGDILRGDLHFYQSAHTTPDGDLASHVMDLAEEDPELFGASIVFSHDWDAEELFELQHRKDGTFVSPDPKNERNLPHARLRELRAVDIVDEPAANEGGMFTASTGAIPAEADALAAYVLGLSNDAPACDVLAGIDANRMRGFASRFMAQRGLSINTRDNQMSGENSQGTENTKPEEGATTEPETTTPEGGQVATDASSTEPEATTEPAKEPTAEEQMSAKFNRYVEAFGAENGPKWFAEKASFEECLGRQVALLNAQNKELQSKLSAAVAANGEDPVTSTPEGKSEGEKPGGKFSGLTEGQSRFAAGIKLPTK